MWPITPACARAFPLIAQALLASASPVNGNIAEYLVPVNADIGELDVTFVEEQDPHVNPLGVKSVGEIAVVGVAPAIAKAVYHATGRRVRELPITPEKLL